MIRSTLIAAIAAAALAAPALADDKAVENLDTRAATAKGSISVFSQNQARVHLAQQGYVNISPLTRDENGAWTGTASKNGKTRMVAVGAKAASTAR